MKKILYTIFLSFLFLLASCSESESLSLSDSGCDESLLYYEKVRNKSLPIMVGVITEWTSFSLNCKHKTAVYTRRLTIDYESISSVVNLTEWKNHIKRAHILFNCNPNDGLTGLLGWTVIDKVSDYNGFLFSLVTKPSDCNYMEL